MDELRDDVARLRQQLAALEAKLEALSRDGVVTATAAQRPHGLAEPDGVPSRSTVPPATQLVLPSAVADITGVPRATAITTTRGSDTGAPPSLLTATPSDPPQRGDVLIAAGRAPTPASLASSQALAALSVITSRPPAPSYPTPPSSARSSAAASQLPPTYPAASGQLPGPTGVPMNATRVVMHQIVMPAEVDQLGICFGGQVLSWIDICAGLSAKTLAKGPCVTATLDALHFLRPCRLGMVVIVAAMVNRTFHSSMEVGVRVEAEDMRTGVRHHCCSAYLTFVSTAAKGPPQRTSLSGSPLYATTAAAAAGAGSVLPRVLPTTPEQERQHTAAAARREARLQEKARRQRDPERAKQAELCRLRPITHREGGPTLPPSLTPPWVSSSGAPPSLTLTLTTPYPGRTPLAAAADSPHVGTARPAEHGDAAPASQSLTGSGGDDAHTRAWPAPDGPDNPVTSSPPPPPPVPVMATRLSLDHGSRSAGSATSTHTHSLRASSAGGSAGAGAPGSRRTSLERVCDQAAARAGALGSTPTGDASGGAAGGREGGAVHAQPPQPLISPTHNRLSVAPHLTRAYMTQSILPQHANTLGITFGGQVMSWMEQCAYVSASRLRAPHILTAAIDSLTFARPTCVGDVLYVTSQVTAIFGSSLEVQVSVHGEDPHVGELFHCADGYITLVTVTTSPDTNGVFGDPPALDTHSSTHPPPPPPVAGTPPHDATSAPVQHRDRSAPDQHSSAAPTQPLPTALHPTPSYGYGQAVGRGASSFSCCHGSAHRPCQGLPNVVPVRLPFVLDPTTPAEHLQAQAAGRRRDDRLALRAALLDQDSNRQPTLVTAGTSG